MFIRAGVPPESKANFEIFERFSAT